MEFNVRARLPMKANDREKLEVIFCRVPTLRCMSKCAIRSQPTLPSDQVYTSNRDILEALFTVRHHDSVHVIPRLYQHCLNNSYFGEHVQLKPFWKRVTDLEKKYLSLRNSHNARCGREGSHQHMNLTSFLDKPFYNQKASITASVTTLPGKATTVKKQVTESPIPPQLEHEHDEVVTPSHPLQENFVTPAAQDKENTPQKPNSSCIAIQVSSPQIKTEGQLKRNERTCRRKIIFQEDQIVRLKLKLDTSSSSFKSVEEKKKATAKELKEKRVKLSELNNRCKQLAADVKHANAKQSNSKASDKQGTSSKIFTELLDENEALKSHNISLEKTLTLQKQKTRQLQKKVFRLKTSKEEIVKSVNKLCQKLTGENSGESVKNICQEVMSLGGDREMLKTLAEAISSRVKTKTKNSYADHIALLMIELQNLGVSQSAVGKVANACSLHLCGRELDSTISRRTAGRMVRRGGILSDVQVAMELHENATNGLRVGQDTTTRRGTEHVSTVWGIKTADGKIKYLQARVQWLPNHTADEQTRHILDQLEGFTQLMANLNIPMDKQLSIAHVIEFIGDHVNDKLHRNLEREHLLAVQAMIESRTISEEEQVRLQFLYKSACQQHSCAKVSRSFFDGMQKLEPPDLGPSIGKYGLQQKKGRSCKLKSN